MAFYALNILLVIGFVAVVYRYLEIREQFLAVRVPDLAYLSGIAGLVDTFEGYAHSHAAAMARDAEAIGTALHLEEKTLVSLKIAAYLHDIGEINLPRDFWKEGKTLSSDEWYLLRTHPLIGEWTFRRTLPADEEVPSIIRWHHERWDGNGYPDRLQGDEIPLAARILAVVDAASAMTQERSYRPARKPDQVRAELESQAGLQFDPQVVRAWVSL